MTATAEDMVTRALRRLQAIDITEQPSAAEMTHSLNVLEEILDGFGANGVTSHTTSMAGVTVDDSDIVTGLESTALIMIGHNVAGTGIAAGTRVREVQSNTRIRLTADATASGSVTLSFVLLPLTAAYESALIAMLAVRLSEDLGLPVSPKLQMDATDGWAAILAGCFPDRKTVFDRSIAIPAGAWDINSDVAV